MNHAHHFTVLFGLGSMLIGSSAAFAQDTPDGLSLEEIIVTAEARAENLQEVPVAVTAFSAQDILDAGIESTADFIALTPNVSFDDSFTVGNSFVSIRGVTQVNNADSPVAIVVDGVPQNNQKQLKMDLFDIERIEVLKGPQGALYGRNAIGGAINIVTKAPSDELEGFVTIGAGNGGTSKIQGGVSGPLIDDRVYYRLSGSYKDSDGLIDNTFLGTEVDFYESTDFRGKLLVQASDSVILDFRLSTSTMEGGATYDSAFWDNTGPGNTNQERLPITDILGTSERNIDEVTFKLDWETSAGSFMYISGYTDVEEDYFGDLDFCNPVDCPGGFFGFGQVDQAQDLQVEMVSHELRFTSSEDQRFRWAAGAFLINTDRSLSTVATLADLGNAPIVMNAEDNDNTASALFAQFEYDISDSLELSMSLRHDEDEREQTDLATGDTRKETFEATQPKVTLTWAATDDRLVYLTYANGFRSGGFNGVGGRAFDDENVDNVELGFKSKWLDDRVLLNVAAYQAESDGFQFFFVDVNAGGAQVIDNFDEVTLSGVEVEFEALVQKDWTVFGSLGIQDSEIDAFNPSLPVPATLGNRTPKTTRSSFNVGTQYGFSVGTNMNGILRVDYERRGDRYWHSDNIDVMDPVSLLNARLGFGTDTWNLTVWGRNLTDEFYYEDFNAQPFTGLPWNIGHSARPRSFGVEFRYEF
ncbi:MAG: TonB-dependent receptor [Gammaproteobacteria bacterium]